MSVQTVQIYLTTEVMYECMYACMWPFWSLLHRSQKSYLKCMEPRHVFVAWSHSAEAILNKFHNTPDTNTENATVDMERQLSD